MARNAIFYRLSAASRAIYSLPNKRWFDFFEYCVLHAEDDCQDGLLVHNQLVYNTILLNGCSWGHFDFEVTIASFMLFQFIIQN